MSLRPDDPPTRTVSPVTRQHDNATVIRVGNGFHHVLYHIQITVSVQHHSSSMLKDHIQTRYPALSSHQYCPDENSNRA